MSLIEDMLQSLENPAMQHAAIVHLPIGLAMVGVPFAFVTAIVTKSKALRWSTVGLYAAFAFFAWLAMQSGEDAHALMKRNQPVEAHEIIAHHEELAEKIWLYAAVVGAMFALTAIDHVVFRRGLAWVAVLAAVFTAGWVAVTGHHGGTAVYEYAVGTARPMTFDELPPFTRAPEGTVALEAEGQAERETASDVPDLVPAGLSEREAHFVANVLPILESTCQRCHNPRRQRRSGQLDLSSELTALHGGNSGPAYVAGSPEESVIMMRIASEDEEVRMPPTEPLGQHEIEAIRQWIADGAVWVEME